MTLPRYGRERYKNSRNLDILPTYTQGMSKSYRRRATNTEKNVFPLGIVR